MPFFGVPIRNGLPLGLGSAAGFGIQPFDPSYLFAAGEQGAWYDPSDYSTLFQDAAGTTPVTAVEQPVGLMLDRRTGLPIGSEKLTNNTFAADADWTKGTGWSIGSGVATKTAGTASVLSQPVTLTAGTTYRLVYTITRTAGTITPQITGGSTVTGTARSAAGTYVDFLTAVSGNTTFEFSAGATFAGTVDNVYLKAISGNDAYQTTSASRPTLSARVNLLTKTEQFDDAVWDTASRLTISANTTDTTDPLGGNTADKGTETIDNGSHRCSQTVVTTANTTFTASCYFKKGTRQWVWANVNVRNSGATNATSLTQFFDLDNLVKGQQTSGQTGGTIMAVFVSVDIVNAANEWRRITLTFTSQNNPADINVTFGLASADGTNSYAGATNQFGYFWGADLRVANDGVGIPAYQRVNTSTDYDTSGFPTYLRFDGSDDSMLTNSVDFSAINTLTGFAGVRAFTGGAVTGVSVPAGTYETYFGIAILDAQGSTGGRAQGTLTITYPTTKVLTAAVNLAGSTFTNRVQLRHNTVIQTLTQSINTATGGFLGTNPIFVGCRDQSVSPQYLNGRIYSLIIRGAASTAAQIASTESWVNGKTKAYA